MTIRGEIPDRNPNIMSTDEMRFWIREFFLRPEYGWCGSDKSMALGRLFYPADKWASSSLRSKLRMSWIYEGERGHFHRTIKAILDGRVVFDPATKRGVWVTNPVPLQRVSRRFDWEITRAGLKIRPRVVDEKFRPAAMPSFANVFKDVPVMRSKKAG